jgi:hypothetical protein
METENTGKTCAIEVTNLVAENATLREALRQIAEMPRPTSPRMKLYNDGLDTCAAIAREALNALIDDARDGKLAR